MQQDLALQPYLQPSDTIDSDHATIRQFAAQTTEDADGPEEKAIRLYYAVRDGIRKAGSSVGAVIEVTARGMPVGLGVLSSFTKKSSMKALSILDSCDI